MTTKSAPPVNAVTSAEAFSRAALLFESDEEVNPIARWTRRRSLAALDAAFHSGDRVIEIGCGTGIEAIHLARRGVTVVATDAAPGMIAAISAKSAPGGPAHDVADRIIPVLLPAHRIGDLLDHPDLLPFRTPHSALRTPFDGAYSSMGPLNCEPDLKPVADGLAQLVKPGGHLVMSIINRWCLWETAWYLRALQPKHAFRRWSGRAEATSRPAWQEEKFTCYYWNRGTIERAFRQHFRVTRREGLPWFLPPLYLDGLIRRAPRLFNRIAHLDRRFASLWPAYDIGDHLLIQFERLRD
jgi:SAM-dependent methyltransferase